MFFTVADEIQNVNKDIKIKLVENKVPDEPGVFVISMADSEFGKSVIDSKPIDISEEFIYFQVEKNGSGKIIVSHQNFLYSFVMNMIENWQDNEIEKYENGKWIKPAFKWHRTVFDYFLNQMVCIQCLY